MHDTAQDPRSSYTAGLRALADALDADPDLPLPYTGIESELAVFVQTKADVVAFSRILTGKADKEYEDDANYGFRLIGKIHGLAVRVYAPRGEVCERVVTGTREVVEEVPDPDALAAVPKVTVTKTVEDVEWRCAPLLAEVSA